MKQLTAINSGFPPTFAQLAKSLGYSPNSKGLIYRLVKELDKDGMVKKVSGRWMAK